MANADARPMVGVTMRRVGADDAGLRLDRWFRRHFPDLTHGRLEKLLRTGQIRVDGARARSNLRLAAGQQIRVPPLGAPAAPKAAVARPAVPAADAAALVDRVLYRDDDMLVVDKPPGLAVQGGTGLARHLDQMLDALRFDSAERPRLVHRLDRDTSGVLVLARSAAAAARLTAAFRGRAVRKLYWALSVGVPSPKRGRVDAAMAKLPGRGGERMMLDEEEGQSARTSYAVLEHAGKTAAWLALAPETGRTHQLRVHCAALGTPIHGDGKYGAGAAFLQAGGLSRKLHLHARAVEIPRADGRTVRVVAPLPPHMLRSWTFFGFDAEDDRDPFAEAA